MKSFFRTLTLTAVVCASSGSAIAVVDAPGPEIGGGAIGAVVATVALLAFVTLPHLKKLRHSKK